MEHEPNRNLTEIAALHQRVEQLEAQLAQQPNAPARQASAGGVLDQQQAKQALLESERFANKVLTASLNGLYIFDIDLNRITFINPQYTRLTGYLLKDLQVFPGEQFLDLYHPDELDRINEHIEKVKQSADGEIFEIEHRLKRADGRWIWAYSYESVFSRHPDGRARQYIGTFIDITARKEAEAKIEMALAGTNAGAWDWNLRTGLVKFSVELYRLLGLNPSHPIPRMASLFRRVHADDRKRVRSEFQQALDHQRPSYAMEFRYLRPDGELIWISSTGRLEYDKRGSGLRAFGIQQDITQRKQAEERLRASEMRFRQLADSMPQLVWTACPDGRVDYYNRRYREYDGITRMAGVHNSDPGESWQWTTALHPDEQEVTLQAWQQALQSGEIYQVEHRVRMFDGSFRWHLSRGLPVRDHKNRVVRWFGTSTDIHDTKRAQASLRERNQRLALISETAGEMLRGANPQDLIGQAYRRLSVMLGLDIYIQYLMSADGTSLELTTWSEPPHVVWGPRTRLQLGQGVSGNAAVLRQPQVIQDVQNSTDPRHELIRGRGLACYACYPLIVHEQLIGTLAFGSRERKQLNADELDLLQTVCDLAATAIARARAEAGLQQYAAKLERSNRDLQEFAFVASHDLQEPLRKIEAFGSILVENTSNLDEKQFDYLSRMRSAAGRMRSMVDDLLALSRVNRIDRPFQRVDLAETVKEVLWDLEMQVKRTGGQVELGELPVVEADPLQMRQLFQNLIGNALKFHRPNIPPVVKITGEQISGGEQISRGGEISRGGDRRGSGQSGRAVQIIIADNGIGFPENETERIFQPFQRLVGRKDFEGSGIGLAICRKIVERHGGEIRAYGKNGQGASFMVTLPVKPG